MKDCYVYFTLILHFNRFLDFIEQSTLNDSKENWFVVAEYQNFLIFFYYVF